MSDDDNMGTMPIPKLVAAIREKANSMDPLTAIVLGVLAGRLTKEDERVKALEHELRRCRVFITSREKMHPDGVALFDELMETANE